MKNVSRIRAWYPCLRRLVVDLDALNEGSVTFEMIGAPPVVGSMVELELVESGGIKIVTKGEVTEHPASSSFVLAAKVSAFEEQRIVAALTSDSFLRRIKSERGPLKEPIVNYKTEASPSLDEQVLRFFAMYRSFRRLAGDMISMRSGIYSLDLKNPPPVGTFIELRILFPDSIRHEVRGEIVRLTGGRAAIAVDTQSSQFSAMLKSVERPSFQSRLSAESLIDNLPPEIGFTDPSRTTRMTNQRGPDPELEAIRAKFSKKS